MKILWSALLHRATIEAHFTHDVCVKLPLLVICSLDGTDKILTYINIFLFELYCSISVLELHNLCYSCAVSVQLHVKNPAVLFLIIGWSRSC